MKNIKNNTMFDPNSRKKARFGILCAMLTAVPSLSAVAVDAVPTSLKGSEADPDKVVVPETAGFNLGSASITQDAGLDRLSVSIDSLLANGSLTNIDIVGSASPEGPEELNRRLALERAEGVRRYLRNKGRIPQQVFHVSSIGENWAGLRKRIADGALTGTQQTRALQIIDNTPDPERREQLLRELDGGKSWNNLMVNVFPLLRTADVEVGYDDGKITMSVGEKGSTMPVAETTVTPMPVYIEKTVEEVVETPAEQPADDDGWQRHGYVKTNVPAIAFFMINAAIEFDLAPHWSLTIPVYWSPFDYVHRDRKYRLLATQPEVRYWPKRQNSGFFVGGHVGGGYYNVAFGGEHRYQDHDRRSPAYGGGISIGYRFCFTRNPRWLMEVTVGGGIYHLDYDIFDNVRNGLITGRRQRTFYGVDNAAVTIAYMFDMGKKKGGRK